jgi:hypothetical protein
MLLRPNSREMAAVRHDCMNWAISAHSFKGDPFQVLATAQLFEEYVLEGKAARSSTG